ncbi:MAG: hypothetical protein ACYS67_04405 [Planctomycetota bacterium]
MDWAKQYDKEKMIELLKIHGAKELSIGHTRKVLLPQDVKRWNPLKVRVTKMSPQMLILHKSSLGVYHFLAKSCIF